MIKKLISVSLTAHNKVLMAPAWVSTLSFLMMALLLVMCRPVHVLHTGSASKQEALSITTPYPVAVRLNKDSVKARCSLMSQIITPPVSEESIMSIEEDIWRSELIRFANKYLGKPYRSGGKTPTGFDCSGFTGFVYANFGLKLPSNSGSQAMLGSSVKPQEAKPGDLAFFGWKTKRGIVVNHAAIVTSKPGEPIKIIHSASGKGIVRTTIANSGYWKNMFLFVKRVEPTANKKG